MSKPHDPDQLSKINDSDRGAVASVWPYPRAPHVRDARITELEAALAFEQLTTAHYAADLVAIVQLCGGDVEDGPSAARECVERVLAERGGAGARRPSRRHRPTPDAI
jgi:hypothetical protein